MKKDVLIPQNRFSGRYTLCRWQRRLNRCWRDALVPPKRRFWKIVRWIDRCMSLSRRLNQCSKDFQTDSFCAAILGRWRRVGVSDALRMNRWLIVSLTGAADVSSLLLNWFLLWVFVLPSVFLTSLSCHGLSLSKCARFLWPTWFGSSYCWQPFWTRAETDRSDRSGWPVRPVSSVQSE